LTNSTLRRASANLPDNFAGLRTISTTADSISVSRELGCSCGSDTGTVIATSDDASGYLDPVSFRCATCQQTTTFFDSQTDGYDGRLNGGSAYQQGRNPEPTTCSACGSVLAKLECGLAYNIDFEDDGQPELMDDAENYFDGIDISASCAECGERRHIGAWELA
jgi:hypothetical protein